MIVIITLHPLLTLFPHLLPQMGNSMSSAEPCADDGQSTPAKPSPHGDRNHSSVPAHKSSTSDPVANLTASLGALSPPSATKKAPLSPQPHSEKASALPTNVQTPGGTRCIKRAKITFCVEDSDDEPCGRDIQVSAISTSEGPLQCAASTTEGDFYEIDAHLYFSTHTYSQSQLPSSFTNFSSSVLA